MNKKINAVAEHYLNSFPVALEDIAEEEVKPKKKKGGILSYLKTYKLKERVEVSPREKAKSMLMNFGKSSQCAQDLEENNVLDAYAWQDLSLICGTKDSPSQHVLGHVKRTVTTAGDCAMAATLVSPTNDLKVLQERQQMTKVLQKDRRTAQRLNEQLQIVEQAEDTIITMSLGKDELRSDSFSNLANSEFYSLTGGARAQQTGMAGIDIDSNSNVSIWKLRAIKILKDVMIFVMLFFFDAGMLFTAYFFLSDTTTFTFSWAMVGSVVWIFFAAFLLHWTAYVRYKNRRTVLDALGEHMGAWADLYKSAQRIDAIVAADTALKACYSHHLVNMRKLLKLAGTDSESGRLLRYLSTLRFRNFSYFFGGVPKLCASYVLLLRHKNCFANTLYELGKLDMHLAIATLLEESKRENAAKNYYVLSTLQETSATTLPILRGKGVWHVGLDSKEAVSNDIDMDSKNGVRTIIITGPNTAGKSVYILSVAINLVLSQSLGIVGATQFSHHLFANMLTYVNPTQSISAGVSLAEAGFRVLQKHRVAITTAKGPVFEVVDEVLNGVAPKVAEEFSYKIMKYWHEHYIHCVRLLTTHYESLPKIGKLPGGINKHVEVLIPGKSGKLFDRTYKIKDGIGHSAHVVPLILKEKSLLEGLDY